MIYYIFIHYLPQLLIPKKIHLVPKKKTKAAPDIANLFVEPEYLLQGHPDDTQNVYQAHLVDDLEQT